MQAGIFLNHHRHHLVRHLTYCVYLHINYLHKQYDYLFYVQWIFDCAATGGAIQQQACQLANLDIYSAKSVSEFETSRS